MITTVGPEVLTQHSKGTWDKPRSFSGMYTYAVPSKTLQAVTIIGIATTCHLKSSPNKKQCSLAKWTHEKKKAVEPLVHKNTHTAVKNGLVQNKRKVYLWSSTFNIWCVLNQPRNFLFFCLWYFLKKNQKIALWYFRKWMLKIYFGSVKNTQWTMLFCVLQL